MENIFLNGAILGMTKQEIKNRFDEIVDFAGVERYIDTPVKRYSSGMYVRLAFGVAAHLEPDILIVDEVLAVGDAEFQKKALGKMKEVSTKVGRTVLFVSHHMAALKAICNYGMLIQNGILVNTGNITDVIFDYIRVPFENSAEEIKFKMDDSRVIVHSAKINDAIENFIDLETDTTLNISISGQVLEPLPLNIQANLFDMEDYPLAFYSPGHINAFTQTFNKGNFEINCAMALPENMNKGTYKLVIGLADPGKQYYGETIQPIIISWNGITTKTGLVFESKKSGWLLLNK